MNAHIIQRWAKLLLGVVTFVDTWSSPKQAVTCASFHDKRVLFIRTLLPQLHGVTFLVTIFCLGIAGLELPPVQETHCREASAKAGISTDTVAIMKNTFMSRADFFSVKKSRSSVVRFKVALYWGCLFTPLFSVRGANLRTRLIPVCHANSCCITCTNCGSLVDVFQNDFLIQTSKDD